MSYNCALQTMVFGSSVLDALSSCPVILVISIVLRKKFVNVLINEIFIQIYDQYMYMSNLKKKKINLYKILKFAGPKQISSICSLKNTKTQSYRL